MSTYLAASMIQHVGNNRTDKALTKDDFGRIAWASCLNFFHTKSMCTPWPFKIYYAMVVDWVKRVNSNSYQFQLCYATTYRGTSPLTLNRDCESVKTITLAEVQEKDPELVCDKDGEEQVCIECCYRSNIFDKSKLGFFILTPKPYKSLEYQTNNYFTYRMVFTPKPGLFPAKNS